MLSNYMIYFWAPPDPGDKYAHHERFEFEEDTYIVFGLFFGVWGIYWMMLHFLDRWTFNAVAWYFEIASFVPVIFYFMTSEEYGLNPLKWWPMFFGYKVECKEKELLNDKQITKLGGPFNVYQVSINCIKFRTKKLAFKYTMFN
tara:strand:- start:732 stop:1163 length:432 start_codon:yes stop_codon:yes gene_type:complete